MLEACIGISLALIVLSNLVLIYLSFKQSILWGVLCFVISPIPFSFVYWSETKRWLGVMLVGFFFLMPVYLAVPDTPYEKYEEAAANVNAAIRQLDENGKFRELAPGEVGALIKCEEDVSLDVSYSIPEMMREWVGETSCRFTKVALNIKLELSESEAGEWELINVNVSKMH